MGLSPTLAKKYSKLIVVVKTAKLMKSKLNILEPFTSQRIMLTKKGRYGFCLSQNPRAQKFSCGPKTLTANQFTITLEADQPDPKSKARSFRDAKLTVTLDNLQMSINELSAEGASIIEDPKTGESMHFSCF